MESPLPGGKPKPGPLCLDFLLSDSFPGFILSSNFSQAALTEFFNFYTAGQPGEIIHDAKFVRPFMWGNFIFH